MNDDIMGNKIQYFKANAECFIVAEDTFSDFKNKEVLSQFVCHSKAFSRDCSRSTQVASLCLISDTFFALVFADCVTTKICTLQKSSFFMVQFNAVKLGTAEHDIQVSAFSVFQGEYCLY